MNARDDYPILAAFEFEFVMDDEITGALDEIDQLRDDNRRLVLTLRDNVPQLHAPNGALIETVNGLIWVNPT